MNLRSARLVYEAKTIMPIDTSDNPTFLHGERRRKKKKRTLLKPWEEG